MQRKESLRPERETTLAILKILSTVAWTSDGPLRLYATSDLFVDESQGQSGVPDFLGGFSCSRHPCGFFENQDRWSVGNLRLWRRVWVGVRLDMR